MPKRPPGTNQLIERISQEADGLRVAMSTLGSVGDTYLHWDELLHRKPPAGLSHDQWWLILKLRRLNTFRTVPLMDTKGEPFRFTVPDAVLQDLPRIDREAAGRIELPAPALSEGMRDQYIFHSLVEEAITSSQLEGAATTRVVAKEMIRSRRRPRDHSERMIMNNYVTMQRIRDLRNESLTPEILLELHQLVTEGTMVDPSHAGRFRVAGETVVVDDHYGEVFHEAPSAEQLPSRVAAMCEFANGDTPGYFVHPVIRAILLHFWLAYDHPFLDGNGRCARALFYWCMLKQGYWLCEYISISEIIRKAPARYGRAFLYCETDENDLTYFLLYHLNVVRQAIDQLREVVKRKAELMRQTESLIRSTVGLNHRQVVLLGHALRHSEADYTVRSHQSSHGVVHRTARTDLQDLTRKGLLVERKIGKTFHYKPAKDLETRLRELQ